MPGSELSEWISLIDYGMITDQLRSLRGVLNSRSDTLETTAHIEET